MNTKEKIEVMQAFLDGKKIQHRVIERQSDILDPWYNSLGEPSWIWNTYEYRIKPQDPIDEAYDRLTANQQFNRVVVDYESFKLGWEACEEAK